MWHSVELFMRLNAFQISAPASYSVARHASQPAHVFVLARSEHSLVKYIALHSVKVVYSIIWHARLALLENHFIRKTEICTRESSRRKTAAYSIRAFVG